MSHAIRFEAGPILRSVFRLGALSLAFPIIACSMGNGGSLYKRPNDLPHASLHPMPEIAFPGAPPKGLSDCNSPGYWDGETLYVLNSWGHPARTSGPDLFHLEKNSVPVKYNNDIGSGRWIESAFKEGEYVYGWYHNEPKPMMEAARTAPRIGAVHSVDNGMTWEDLGIILEARLDGLHPDTKNNYFTGGHGDFSVIPDRKSKYVYFFFSTYSGETTEQGVAVARMRFDDLDSPKDKVFKWHNGQWKEAGLGGRVSPVFPVRKDWHGTEVDAFWGPSIHWNTYLKQYVILMNRAVDPVWKQEGIYITFNPDLAHPENWSEPSRLDLMLDGPIHMQFYPQVFGTDSKARETDKLAGKTARLFVAGHSKWEIQFHRAGEQ